jgi:hypothetical protein
MSIQQEHCATILEALAMVQKVSVTGPIGEVAHFAQRVFDAANAITAYSDALYPDSEEAGAAMLRAESQECTR